MIIYPYQRVLKYTARKVGRLEPLYMYMYVAYCGFLRCVVSLLCFFSH